jgi:hypothetical protein
MNVKKTNTQSELQAVRNLVMPAISHPILYVNTPLTYDIITDEGYFYFIHPC